MGSREADSAVIHLEYTDVTLLSRKKVVKDSFMLDYWSYTGSLYIKSDLKDIRDSIGSIQKSVAKLANSKK